MNFLKNNYYLLLLIIIIVLAFFLRSPMFLHGDFYLLADQGRDLQLAKQIIVDHKLTLIGGRAGFGGVFHGPLWWYMITPFFLLSHGNPFFSLVPLYILVSLGIVIGGFFVGKNLYGFYTGLLFALVIGISNFYITTISFTSNSQVMPLIFLFFIYCAIKYLRGKNHYLVALFSLTAIGINFESAFAVTLIPLTVMAIIFRKKIPSMKLIFISAVAFIIPVSSFILFDLRHEFLMSKAFLNLISGNFTQASSDMRLNDLFFRAQDRFNSLLSTISFLFFAENVFSKFSAYLVLFGAGALFLLQLRKKMKLSQEDKELIFIFLIPIVVYTFYMFVKLPIQGHYVASLGISIILFFILTLRKIAKFNLLLSILFLVFFVSLQIAPLIDLIKENYFRGIPYSTNSNGSYLNQRAIVDAVFNDSKGKPFGYFVFDLPIITYSMDYLFWWRGNTLYHYVPKSEKFPTTYVILNPAKPGDLHAHDFWLTHTIRTKAPVIKKWVMPGDVIILKLAIPKGEQPADPNYYQNLIFR